MKTGVSTACLYPMLLEDAFESLASRGVANIEVFINTHCELMPDFIQLLKTLRDHYCINICSMHPFTSASEALMFTPYKRRLTDTIEYYKLYFDAMNKLGSKILVFHGNKPQNPFPEEQYFENFAALSEAAKSFGVILAQENVARCVSADINFLRKMSDYLGDNAHFNVDIKQAIRSNEDPFEVIDALKGKIVNIHFSDNNEEKDCLPYGEGNFDAKLFLKRLHDNGYTGNIILELYNTYSGGTDLLADNYRLIKKAVDDIC